MQLRIRTGGKAARTAGVILACLALAAAASGPATAVSTTQTYTIVQTSNSHPTWWVCFSAPLVPDIEFGGLTNGQSKVGQVISGVGKPLVEFRILAAIPYGMQYVMKIAAWNNGSPSGAALWTSPIRTSANESSDAQNITETMKVKLNKGTDYLIYLEWVYPTLGSDDCQAHIVLTDNQYFRDSVALTGSFGWISDPLYDLVFRAKFA